MRCYCRMRDYKDKMCSLAGASVDHSMRGACVMVEDHHHTWTLCADVELRYGRAVFRKYTV